MAYRMLGSLAEADEAVQDAWLRVSRLGDGVWILEGYVVMNSDADGDVLDEVYAVARDHFSEDELVSLTITVIATNGFNRLNIASGRRLAITGQGRASLGSRGDLMKNLSMWSLIGLCFSMACAIGGGLYEHIVLTPIWSAAPPSSFAIIQPKTGVPLQRFWIAVHIGITVFLLLALFTTWRDVKVRRILLLGLASYVVMRVWSGVFFIPEMLAFQQVPLNSPPSVDLRGRVDRWTSLTLWREPLDVLSFLCFLLAVFWLKRPSNALA